MSARKTNVSLKETLCPVWLWSLATSRNKVRLNASFRRKVMRIKAVYQYIPVVTFIMLKGILNSQSGKKSFHSKESY